MATRSAIGIVELDGSIAAIYCHNDGYVEHNGRILNEHYTDFETVDALIDMGNLSSLSTKAETSVAYGRDRGEANQEAKTFKNVEGFLKHYGNAGCEFFYLFDGHKWEVLGCVDDDFISLDKAINDLENVNEELYAND